MNSALLGGALSLAARYQTGVPVPGDSAPTETGKAGSEEAASVFPDGAA